MIMTEKVPEKIYEVLKSAIKGDIEDFTVSLNDSNKKGDGYLGQVFFVVLRHKSNGKQLNFVVKQAFCEQNIREFHPIRDAFTNEIYFYTKLWPKFQEFQKIIPPRLRFDHLAKCLAVNNEENFEKLVLENLKDQGFIMHDKRKALDMEKFESIFKLYGKFHAISFAYKALKPEEFSELANSVTDVWVSFSQKQVFQDAIMLAHRQCFDNLEQGADHAIVEKYKHYLEDGMEVFRKSLTKGTYTIAVHGDCWSNNMMFKYDANGKLIDIRLLDFQMVKIGSPVCDLAYCLYSGGTREVFDDLDRLLRIYYDSLSENLKAYGCDPDELYPLEALKNDWKLHCQLGVAMGLLLWRMRLTYDSDSVDLTDISDDQGDAIKIFDTKFDEKTFKQRARDIILHLHKNNYIL